MAQVSVKGVFKKCRGTMAVVAALGVLEAADITLQRAGLPGLGGETGAALGNMGAGVPRPSAAPVTLKPRAEPTAERTQEDGDLMDGLSRLPALPGRPR